MELVKDFSVEQVKAARMLLGWDQAQLAAAASVGIATVKRIESGSGPLQSTRRITEKVMLALEAAGIEFLGAANNMPGVLLKSVGSVEENGN